MTCSRSAKRMPQLLRLVAAQVRDERRPTTRTRSSRTPRASGRRRSSVSERLLRLKLSKKSESVALAGRAGRSATTSPPTDGSSILITSAPRSASCIVPYGPAPYCSIATTRTSASGPSEPLDSSQRLEHPARRGGRDRVRAGPERRDVDLVAPARPLRVRREVVAIAVPVGGHERRRRTARRPGSPSRSRRRARPGRRPARPARAGSRGRAAGRRRARPAPSPRSARIRANFVRTVSSRISPSGAPASRAA